MAGVILVQDDDSKNEPAPATLTTTVLAGPPQQLRVSDGAGVLATLTVGAKTVTVRGQTRTFTEQKRPFVDAFARTSTSTWGQSPGGGNWVNSGDDTLYTVNGSTGLIPMDVAGTSRHATLFDNGIGDVNVLAKVTVGAMPAGAASSVSVSFGYQDTNNSNRARVLFLTTGSIQLALEKEVAGTTTVLGAATTLGTGFTANQWWWVRAERAGSTVRCRAWKDGTAEPGTWTHSVTDTELPTGRVGVRAIASSGSTVVPSSALVDEFTVTSASWVAPPTVTHSTWVRVLPAPFDGTWTAALADQVRAWATDTRPDTLAFAMMYVSNAPPVTAPALGGAQVAGQASYGPLASDGTPTEGADFHDYMGQSWTFGNGETQSADPAELRCLDCSGFVRMIYGYHMGVPMVRTANIDGTNLPRMTKDIGPSGPGVIVAQASGTAPQITGIQIGDVPHFDADQSDPIAGQLDHNGIYLGVDTLGHPRFVNSRKTPMGPTFGDLGGASTLDGTGTYATSLRIIRRF